MKQITLAAFLISSCLYAETSAFSPPSFQQIFEHVTQLPKAVQGIAFLITAKSRALLNLEESTLLKTTSVDLQEEQNVLPNKRVQEFNQERYEQLQQSFEEDQLSFAELEEYLLLLREYEQLQNRPELEQSPKSDSTPLPLTHQTISTPGMKMAGNCFSGDNKNRRSSNKNQKAALYSVQEPALDSVQGPVQGVVVTGKSECACMLCLTNKSGDTPLDIALKALKEDFSNPFCDINNDPYNIDTRRYSDLLTVYLINHKNNPMQFSQRNANGDTPIHEVVRLNPYNIAALLI